MSELNQQVKELKRLSRLKDDFIAITSKDLRSPLAGILTSIDMLKTQVCTPEESNEFLQSIHNSGTGLLNLIDDLIVLSKLQSDPKSLVLKPIPLFAELKQSLTPFKDLIQAKNLTLETSIDFHDPPIVMANVDAIFNIMDHLVSIAVDCSPPNGTISIKVSPQGADAVAVFVEDNGPGMSAEQLESLFKWEGPTAGRNGSRAKGQGMAFLIVHDLVEKQNATIQVFSEPGAGTQVKIVFPLEMEALSA
jgi:signal transduction histidine kinase